MSFPLEHPYSFAKLLGFNCQIDYDLFLSKLGWAKTVLTTGKSRIQHDAVERFVQDHLKWKEFLEFNRSAYKNKKHVFLRVGVFEERFTPSSQLADDSQLKMPRLAGDNGAIREFRTSYRRLVMQDHHSKQPKKMKESMKSPDEAISGVPIIMRHSGLSEERMKQCLSRKLLDQKIFQATCSVDEVLQWMSKFIDKTMEPVEKSCQADEEDNYQNEAVAEAVGDFQQPEVIPPAVSPRRAAALSHAIPNQKFTEALEVSSFPVLSRYGIDIKNQAEVMSLMRDITKLRQSIQSVDIFRFAAYNDKDVNLINVPASKDRKQFIKNLNRNRRSWVMHVLDAVVGSQQVDAEMVADEDDPEDLVGTARADAALWLVTYLGRKFPDQFVQAATDIGMPVHHTKMPSHVAAAMWEAAGMGLMSQRIVHKYFLAHFGWKFAVPEKAMEELSANVILPITARVTYQEKSIHFWYKNVETVVEEKVGREITLIENIEVNNMDLVIGADHGQGSFRAVMKMILRCGETKHLELEYGLGEVECKKDPSDLVRKTLAPVLNEGLKKMVRYTRNAEGKIIRDGRVTFYKIGNDPKVRACYDESVLDEGADGLQVIKRIDIRRIIITGDLAFYAMLLGMENHSSAWCWLCSMSKKDWTAEPNEPLPDNQRTLATIMEIASRLPVGEKAKKSVKGMIEQPLIDCIEPERYVVPALHLKLGITNALLADFKKFIFNLLEKVPLEIKELQSSDFAAEEVLLEAKEQLKEWDGLNGATLASHRYDRSMLKELIDHGAADDTVYTRQEMNEMKSERVSLTNSIKELTTHRKELEKICDEGSKRSREARKELDAAMKKASFSMPVRTQFDETLEDHGVTPSSYHGGDLEGNACSLLMERAPTIFHALEEYFVTVANERNMHANTIDGIRKRCCSVRDTLIVFDSLFSLVNMPNKDVTANAKAQVRQLAEAAAKAWRGLKKNVPPKVHVIEHHIHAHFDLYDGLVDFSEQFVERRHQYGKRDNWRSRGLRNKTRKFCSHAKWEEQRIHTDVKRVHTEVQKKRKRNPQATLEASESVQAKRRAKEEIRTTGLLNFEASSGDVLPTDRDIMREEWRLQALNQDEHDEGNI